MRTFIVKCYRCGKIQPYQTKSKYLYGRGFSKKKKCQRCEKTFVVKSEKKNTILKEVVI